MALLPLAFFRKSLAKFEPTAGVGAFFSTIPFFLTEILLTVPLNFEQQQINFHRAFINDDCMFTDYDVV